MIAAPRSFQLSPQSAAPKPDSAQKTTNPWLLRCIALLAWLAIPAIIWLDQSSGMAWAFVTCASVTAYCYYNAENRQPFRSSAFWLNLLGAGASVTMLVNSAMKDGSTWGWQMVLYATVIAAVIIASLRDPGSLPESPGTLSEPKA